jgi:hypothetical protein
VLLANKELKFSCDYPVLYTKNQEIFESLLKEIIIARLKYLTYKEYLNRIVITANHNFEDLNKLAKVLNVKEN